MITNLGIITEEEFGKIAEENQRRRERERNRLEKEVGQKLTESQINALFRYEKEIAVCRGCQGKCRKEKKDYMQPTIRKEQGELWIATAECHYSRQNRLQREFKLAQIPPLYADKTFDDYRQDAVNEKAVRIARWYATEQPPKSLYLYGGCGAGKTYLAALTAKEFVVEGKQVIFGDVPTLLDEIKRTFDGNGNSQEIIDRYCSCDLLVLDDFGAGLINEWRVGVLYRIINSRYVERKSLIVTSNFDFKGLQKRMADKDEFSTERIISRLEEICIKGFLGTEDRRKKS